MPPFFFGDYQDPEPAGPEEAVPALEALAANNGLRDLSLKRFDADEPPPYESSTDPEDYDHGLDLQDPPSNHDDGPEDLPDDVLEIINRPLDDTEIESIAAAAHHLLSPAEVFYGDALREGSRMPFSESFRQAVGVRRRGLLVRHLLKNRWRKLGVWNNAWGFAGRNVSPADRYRDWRWTWEPQGDESREAVEATRKLLVARALRLRQTLRRGEHAPGAPQSHLEPDSTVSQAESFLISRPWFIFRLENFENTLRINRLPRATLVRYKGHLGPSVRERWQERGEWREEFWIGKGFGVELKRVTSWKWRHESPSPEPEDMSCITIPWHGVGLRHYHQDLGFTPSEFDEIEVLELPVDKRPENSWIVQDSDFDQPPIPGQVHRIVEERAPLPLSLLGKKQPALYTDSAGNAVDGPTFFFGRPLTSSQGEQVPLQMLRNEPDEPRESEELEQRDEPEPPVIPEESPRQSVLTEVMHEESKQSSKDASSPAPRQSARAAASKKRKAEAPLPEPLPPKRLRQSKPPTAPTTRAAKGKAASATSGTTGAKRGRPAGRPRKTENQEGLPATRTKGPSEKALEPVPRRGRIPKEKTKAAPSTSATKGNAKKTTSQPTARRGRPAKSESSAKPSVAVTKAKQRVMAQVVGKRGRPAKRQAPAKAPAAAAKESKPSTETPQATPRRGRPSKAQAQEKKAVNAAVAGLAKGKQQETAPEASVVTPRRGRPSKTATPATAALAKSSRPAVPEEVPAVTPRRGRPTKAATAAATAAAENAKPSAPEETVTPRTRGRPSKASIQAAAGTPAGNDKTSGTEEAATPRSRGRPGKAALTAAAASAAIEKIKEAVPEESDVTPRRRGRPARQAAPSQEEDPTPAPVPAAAAVPKGKASSTNKKSAAPPRIATPQQWVANRNRVSKRTTASNSGSSGGRKTKKAVVPAASPATRGRGRPKKA